MNLEHKIPIGHVHLAEGLVAQGTGVVDQDVELAELAHRLIHQALGALESGDGIEVGHGLPAGGADLGHHLVGHSLVFAAGFA